MMIFVGSVVIGLLWSVLPASDMPVEQEALLLLTGYVSQAYLAWPLRPHAMADTVFASIGLALWIPLYLSGSSLRTDWVNAGVPVFDWLWLWQLIVLVVCPLVILAGIIRTFMRIVPGKPSLQSSQENR